MSDMPKTHVMIDTETLGLAHDAAILSVAVVPFQFEADNLRFEDLVTEGLHIKLSVKDQLKHGRKVDDSTVSWWKEQEPDARKILMPTESDLCINDAVVTINKFFKKCGFDGYVWSRGIGFDLPKIRHMYESIGAVIPWKYFVERDVRTMCDCLTGSTRGFVDVKQKLPHFIKHNALHDAAKDALMMWEIYQSVLKGESYEID